MSVFIYKVIQGSLSLGSPLNEARLRQELKDNEGKEYRLTKLVHTRSLSQNALYHMFLNVIERETGQSADSVHEWAKRKFLKARTITVNGEQMRIPGTTTNLTKTEFSDYMDKIAAQVEVAIPDTEKFIKQRDEAPTND